MNNSFNAACARILHNYAAARYTLSGPPRLTDDQLRTAIDYIHDHIGGALELGAISRAAGLSQFHESISKRGLRRLLLNLGLLFSLHSRIPTNEGLPELVIEYLRPDLE